MTSDNPRNVDDEAPEPDAHEPDAPEPEHTDSAAVDRVLDHWKSLQPEEVAVEYPERSRTDKTTMTRKRDFSAWVGKPDRLTRIEQQIDSALRRAFEDAKPEIESQSTYVRKGMIEGFVPETRVAGAGRLERRGDLATILSEMDAREIEWVQIANSPYYQSERQAYIKVAFGRDPSYRSLGGGARLEVTGTDPQWVAGTYDRLATEMAKDVPWWWPLRSDHAFWGYLVVSWLAVVFGLGAAWTPPAESRTLVAVAGGVAAAVLGLGTFAALRKWMLLDFELVEAGERSTARRIGGAVVAAIGLVSAVVGIWAVLGSQRG